MSFRHRTAALRLLATLALLALAGMGATGVVHGAPGETIETVAGSGAGGLSGDGGPATSALLTDPSDVALTADGGYLIADTGNNRIRRVDAAGTISTVAGGGPCCGAAGGIAGDGGLATSVDMRLNQPRGVSPLANGRGFLIADTGNSRIRKVEDGIVTTVAGGDGAGFTGDGGPATAAQLDQPLGVAALPGGGYLIADTGNDRIRRVSAGGTITTVAGGSLAAFSGDGGPATAALLNAPARVAPLGGGGFLIADTGNDRIRRVDAGGTITTVAGSSSTPGFGGDGGPAGKALLDRPEGVAALPDGSIAIADTGNERVRLVGVDGTIRTLAGTGTAGLSGDGGDPELAQLSHPRAVAGDGTRTWIADASNQRIRRVAQPPPPPDDSLDPTPPLGVSPPVLGKSVVAKPRAGRVLVRLPGSDRFAPLTAIENVPMNSEVDVERGSILVFFATNPTGRRAKAIASDGRMVLRQRPHYVGGQRPGELQLSGPLYGCGASPRRQVHDGAGASARSRAHASRRGHKKHGGHARHGRRLKVRARGRIRTRGRYGAATVRGTRWMTVDRCPTHPRPGTLVVVSKGIVAMRSFVLRKTVLVPAGHRFLAPARRRRG